MFKNIYQTIRNKDLWQYKNFQIVFCTYKYCYILKKQVEIRGKKLQKH